MSIAPTARCHVRQSRKSAPAAIQHRVAAELPLVEANKTCSKMCRKDWASDWRTLLSVWGFPAVAMLAAAWFEPTLRAVVWTAMLIWMGGACLANARRCGRTHCRFTGPYFLLMAATVVVYASEVAPLGPHGWTILGLATVVGNALIWWGSERLLGAFRRAR